jgi:FMN phosphatase YigB (HAD superfamily)
MIVGDSLTSDIRGGNNADILCCWYNPHGGENTNNLRVDYEITDISQVQDIIQK